MKNTLHIRFIGNKTAKINRLNAPTIGADINYLQITSLALELLSL